MASAALIAAALPENTSRALPLPSPSMKPRPALLPSTSRPCATSSASVSASPSLSATDRLVSASVLSSARNCEAGSVSTGAWLTAVTLRVTVAVSVVPLEVTVYWKLSVPV
ncbi:hypothetical protein MASR2M32_09790 [Sphaerotilus sulfidivorans]